MFLELLRKKRDPARIEYLYLNDHAEKSRQLTFEPFNEDKGRVSSDNAKNTQMFYQEPCL